MEKKKYLMPCIDIIREVHSPFLAGSNDEWTGDQLGKEVEMEMEMEMDEDLWGRFSDDIKDYSEEWSSRMDY